MLRRLSKIRKLIADGRLDFGLRRFGAEGASDEAHAVEHDKLNERSSN